MPFSNSEGGEGDLPTAVSATPQANITQEASPAAMTASGGKHVMGAVHYPALGSSYAPQLTRPPPLSRSAFTSSGSGYTQLAAQPSHGSMLGSSLNQYSTPAGQSVGDNRALGQRYSLVAPGYDSQHGFVDGVRHRGWQIQEEEFGSGGKARRGRKLRNPSPYNLFMSEEVKRIKAEHPTVDHKQAFKMAARHWAKSPYDCRKVSSLRSITSRDGPSVTSQAPCPNVEPIPGQIEPLLRQHAIGNDPVDSLMASGQIKHEGLLPGLAASMLDPNGIVNFAPEAGGSVIPASAETIMAPPPTSIDPSQGPAISPEAQPRPPSLEAFPSSSAAALMSLNPRTSSSDGEESLPQVTQIAHQEAQNQRDVHMMESIGLDLSQTAFLASSHITAAKVDEAPPIE